MYELHWIFEHYGSIRARSRLHLDDPEANSDYNKIALLAAKFGAIGLNRAETKAAAKGPGLCGWLALHLILCSSLRVSHHGSQPISFESQIGGPRLPAAIFCTYCQTVLPTFVCRTRRTGAVGIDPVPIPSPPWGKP